MHIAAANLEICSQWSQCKYSISESTSFRIEINYELKEVIRWVLIKLLNN